MVCPNVKHWLVIAKRPWRRCFSILRTIVIGKTLTWWTLEVLRLMLDQFCEGHEVNSWRPGTISKVALKANEGRWSDSVIFSPYFFQNRFFVRWMSVKRFAGYRMIFSRMVWSIMFLRVGVIVFTRCEFSVCVEGVLGMWWLCVFSACEIKHFASTLCHSSLHHA